MPTPTKSDFARVKAELGERPAMPSTGPLSFLGYRSISDAEFQRRMDAYDAQEAACRAWDRAFKARLAEIASRPSLATAA